MKNLLRIVTLVLFFVVSDDVFSFEIGQEMARFRGVVAKYNGPAGNIVNDYQCVEYVKRFYYEEYSFPYSDFGSIGEARNLFYEKRPLSLTAYENGSSLIPPVPGDILCFDGGPAGHVAIIKQVFADHVRVIEQNWSAIDAERNIPLQLTNGYYRVVQSGTTYWVQGWLHHPQEKVGHFSDGWHFDGSSQSIADCYDRLKNAGNNIGKPFDNTGGTLPDGLYVHRWYSPNGLAYVVIQDFKNQSTNQYFAIIYNPYLKKAFLIKEGFRWQYLNNPNAPYEYGVPWSDEYQWTDTGGKVGSAGLQYTRQDFSNDTSDKMLLWRAGFQVTVHDAVIDSGGGDLGIAGFYTGDGQNLTLAGWAQSDTSIYLTGNFIINAVRYPVYREYQYVGDFNSNLEFTDTGLLPNTSYSYTVKALDANGTVLTQASLTVTTKPLTVPEVPMVDFQYWLRTGGFEVGVPSYSGATTAQILVNSTSYPATPGTFYTVSGLANGSYNIRVDLFNNQGNLVAQSLTKTITLGQPLTVTSSGTVEIGPNEQGEVVFTVGDTLAESVNLTDNRTIQSADTWLQSGMTSFASFTLNPYSSTTIRVPISTPNTYWNSGSTALAIYAEGKASSGQLVTMSLVHKIKVKSFIDLVGQLASNVVYVGNPASLTLTVNNGNSSTPAFRFEIYQGTQLIVSALGPQLAAGEVFQQEIPVGTFNSPTELIFTLVVDPLNEVMEVNEENNFSSITLQVVDPPPPKPSLTLQLPAGVTMEFVQVPSGTYLMGSPETERGRTAAEGPQQLVTVPSLWVGKYEVTNQQYAAVIDGTNEEKSNHPRVYVSWNEITGPGGVIEKLNAHLQQTGQGGKVRLPSEAEFEWFASGGVTTRFHFGDSLSVADGLFDGPAEGLPGNRSDYMLFGGNSLQPVGQKLPNQFGLFDTHGSAWEWCQDNWHDWLQGVPLDGSAWETPGVLDRVYKGGGWVSEAWNCRPPGRDRRGPNDQIRSIGFRLIYEPPAGSTSSVPTPTPTPTPEPTPTPTPTPSPSPTPTPLAAEVTLNLPQGKTMTFKRIPAGSFLMGSPTSEPNRIAAEGPQHEVNIAYDYYLGQYEVTQGQWSAVMGFSSASGYGTGEDYIEYYKSWNDGQALVVKINEHLVATGQKGRVRLPTEAEWEKAARAGSTTPYYWGETVNGDYLWFRDNSGFQTHPVGQKLPNAYGLYDMLGNVWEWVQDNWSSSYDNTPRDGSAHLVSGSTSVVYRSGAFLSDPTICRSAYRDYRNVNDQIRSIGLRLCYVAE